MMVKPLLETSLSGLKTADGTGRLLQTIIDTEPECVKLLARDNTLLEMNRAGLRMIEAESRDTVIGTSVLPLIAAEYRDRFAALIERVFAGTSGSLEFQIVGLRGTRRWMETHAVPVRNHADEVVAALAITRDVSGLRRAEAALRRGEALFRAVVEHSSDAIALLDADGTVQYASPATVRVLGYAPETLVGRSLLDIVHPDDLSRALEAVSRFAGRPGTIGRGEARVRRGDGSYIWVEAVANNLLEESEVEAIVVNYRDVTDRKRTEEALRDSEARFRLLAENAKDIIFRYTLHPSRGFQYVSQAVTGMTGYSPQEHYADPDLGLKLAHPDDREVLRRILQGLDVPAGPLTMRWIHRDGSVIWTEQRIVPIRDDTGRLVAIEGVARDVTERMRAEQDVEGTLSLLRSTLEATADGILVVEGEGEIVTFNRRFVEMWGIPEEVMASRDGGRLIAFVLDQLKDSEGFQRKTAQLSHSREESHDILEFTDGRVFERFSKPRIAGETVRGRVWTFRDVTERRQTETEVLTQLERLTSLYATAQKLSQSLQVRELSEFIVETAVKMFGAGLAWLGRAEADGSVSLLSAHPGDDPYPDLLHLRWDEAEGREGPAGRALRTGFPVVIGSPESLPADHAEALRARGFRCAGAFPLITQDRPYGVLTLYSADPAFFAPGRIEFYQAFAHQAAAALENARLFEESQRRAGEFAALYEMHHALAAHQDPRDLLQTIVDRATDLLRVSGCTIELFDPQRQDLELVVARGFPFPIGSRMRLGEGVVGQVAQTRQPLIVDAYQQWEHRAPQFATIPLGAVVGVPMLYRGELIGVLTANELAASPRRFTDEDVRLLSLFAGQAAAAVHNTHLFDEARRRLEQLQALHEIDTAISSSLDVRVTLNVFLDKVTATLGVDAADVLLLNPQAQVLEYIAGRGFRTGALQHTRLRLGQGYAGEAALSRQTIVVGNVRATPGELTRSPLLGDEGFASYIATPLIAKGQVKGVLEIFHRAPLIPADEWLRFLGTLAGQAAIAIDNATLVSELQRANVELTLAYDTTLEGWSRALDLRDKETEGHTQRVTELALRLAREMGVSDAELVHLRRGALLHDMGKVGIPDSILLKPGPLTDQEWEIMRRHPMLAYELLVPIPHLRRALDIPLYHHEKWDGTGYPQRLQGEEIPLAARIFAVVDVWDALCSDRPYRRAWSASQAITYIREQAGKHFDPRAAEVFLRLIENDAGRLRSP